MRALLSWMQEFAPGIAGDPFELGDTLSGLGLCCDEVVLVGSGLDGVVVAEVIGLRPHPSADRIQLVDVDAGDGAPLQVCCGAFNMAVGDLVPLATVGTTMPGGLEISRRKLRGEWSNGMLCSSRELDLGDDHDGILVLPPGLEVGEAFAAAMGITSDVVFDLDLTPNRPDAMSILGVARDLAAKLGVPFEVPVVDVPSAGEHVGSLATVEVADPELCGRFTARVLSGLEVGTSGAEIARRLTLSGMRPINSIVDISNYVMLEYGQPNHTFDLGRVGGGGLRVRRARAGELIDTLDGQQRALEPGDGVIADGNDVPIGIAGVMGGASTEVSASTTEVLLELAWWDPPSVGATAKRLGLRSEASARFEKGIDPEIASCAADRFAQLATASGAVLHPGEIVVEGRLPERTPILVRTERVNAVLATDFDPAQIASYLTPIGFTSTAEGGDLLVTPPSWRPDSTIEIDVVEEVARHHGYDRLGKSVPRSPFVGLLTPRQRETRALRDLLVGIGLTEVTPMPFLAPGELESCSVRVDGVRVANPLVAEESVLRTALLPGILRTLAYNATHRISGAWVFEIGHCYAAPPDGADMPDEWEELAIALGGDEAPAAVEVLEHLLGGLGRGRPVLRNAAVGGLHPTRAATVSIRGNEVGEAGELDPVLLDSRGIGERVGWIRLDLDRLLGVEPEVPQARPLSRYPSADLDLAFALPDDVAPDEVLAVLEAADPTVVGARLFDVYRGDQVEVGMRSLAFALRLQALDRTLSEDDVAAIRRRLIGAVTDRLGGQLR